MTYLGFVKAKFNLSKSKRVFKLSIELPTFFRSGDIQILLRRPMAVYETVHVVTAEILSLAGLNLLAKYWVVIINVHGILERYNPVHQTSSAKKSGHVYLYWDEPDKMIYTHSPLRKLYKKF